MSIVIQQNQGTKLEDWTRSDGQTTDCVIIQNTLGTSIWVNHGDHSIWFICHIVYLSQRAERLSSDDRRSVRNHKALDNSFAGMNDRKFSLEYPFFYLTLYSTLSLSLFLSLLLHLQRPIRRCLKISENCSKTFCIAIPPPFQVPSKSTREKWTICYVGKFSANVLLNVILQ